MAFKSSEGMGLPLSSSFSSVNVGIPFWVKAAYRGRRKLWRVSSPLKLRNTSKIHLLVRNEKLLPSVSRAIDVEFCLNQQNDLMKLFWGVRFYWRWESRELEVGEIKDMGVRVNKEIMDLWFIDIDEMIANAQQVLGRRRPHIEFFFFFFFWGLKTRLSSNLPNIILIGGNIICILILQIFKI